MIFTVKDALKLLRTTDDIRLGWNGLLLEFNPESALDVDAYGDYLVSGIRANGVNCIEIDLLATPTRASNRA